jgi:protein-tyrosine phosphatase
VVTIAHPALPAEGRLICGPRLARPFRSGVAGLLDAGVSTIACLLADHEMPAELVAAYETSALQIVRYPIADFGRPASADSLRIFVDDLLARMRAGQTIYLHCFAGLGRTGTVLACLLKAAGASGDPVALVRTIYDARALETEEQQRFARAFAPAPSTRPGSAGGATADRADPPGAGS